MKKIILLALLTLNIHANTIEKSGDALLLIIPSLAFGSTLYLDDKEGQIQLVKSALSNAVVTYGLKFSINKTRPNGENDRSFPSGHTSATFQGASFIHRRYGLTYGLLAYAGAVYTGYTRVHADKHYVEDVLAGALVGVLSTYAFTSASKIHFEPFLQGNRYGIGISKSW